MTEGFTDIEYAFCQDITQKLINNPLSLGFLYPVDPSIPNYYDIIKEPMDLGTVKKNLDDRVYQNSEQWKHDIILIWNNSIKFNKKGIFKAIAEKLKKLSLKMMKIIPKTETDLWYIQLCQAANELQSFLKHNPTSIPNAARPKSQKKYRE